MLELNSTDAYKEFTGKNNDLSFLFSYNSLIMEMKDWPLNVEDIPNHGQVNLSGDEDLINFNTTALILNC